MASPSWIEHSVADLHYLEVHNAAVLPTAVSSSNGSVRGGLVPISGAPLYTQQLRQIGQSVGSVTRFRHNDPTGFSEPGAVPEIDSRPSMYLGPLHNHYGHFITETMTRVWYLLDGSHKDVRVVAMPEVSSVEERSNFVFESLRSWQQEIFRFFDIDLVTFIKTRTIFENLAVPEQGGLLFSDIHKPDYLDILSAHSHRKLGERGSPVKIFYRRPLSDVGGKLAGEGYIAAFLEQFGYACIFPEMMDASDQIKLAYNASHAISIQGSALHTFNLLGRSPVDVLIIRRSTDFASFLRCLKPYVRSTTIYQPDRKLSGVRPDNGLLIAGKSLVDSFVLFDKSIDAELFDYQKYFDSVAEDVQIFCDVKS
ncbi:glycosyltransferase 61 family protein [Arthrobacter sp. Sr33]